MSDTKECLWYLFIQTLLNRQNKTVIVKNVCFSYKQKQGNDYHKTQDTERVYL